MASDGSQPVAWAGQAFPYLLHHHRHHGHQNCSANGEKSSENSPILRQSDGVAGSGLARDGTGTWSGPAPRGYVEHPMHAEDEAVAMLSAKEPEYVMLRGGIKMPLLAFGTEALSYPTEAVLKALSLGYRHIDCAASYENENLVGEAIASFLQSDGKREELWVTSKVWNDAHRRDSLHASVTSTIENLRCGYLDLLLLHWPNAWTPGGADEDSDVSFQETWAAMEEAVDRGFVRHLGLCNFDLVDVENILEVSNRHRPLVNQIELHPLLAQRKLVGVCNRMGIQCFAHSSVGPLSKSEVLDHLTIQEVSASVHKSPEHVVLKWNLQRGLPVVVNSEDEKILEEIISEVFSWRLAWQEKAKLDSIDANKRLLSPPWAQWRSKEEGGVTKPSRILLEQQP